MINKITKAINKNQEIAIYLMIALYSLIFYFNKDLLYRYFGDYSIVICFCVAWVNIVTIMFLAFRIQKKQTSKEKIKP